jgi:hypothetical protein
MIHDLSDMRKKIKQLINAYLSYAFGFWAIAYLAILCSALFSDQKIKTVFSGEIGLFIGIFLIAFMALFTGIVFYIWIALRQAMLKAKLNLQNLYKYSFLAGLLTPIAYFIVILCLLSAAIKNSNFLIAFMVLIIVVFAECCVRLNIKNSYQNHSSERSTVAEF